MWILTVHVNVHSGLQRVRSIVIGSETLELGVQMLSTKISNYDLVADKMAPDARPKHSRDITCQLLVAIPRDHRARFSCKRIKEISTSINTSK